MQETENSQAGAVGERPEHQVNAIGYVGLLHVALRLNMGWTVKLHRGLSLSPRGFSETMAPRSSLNILLARSRGPRIVRHHHDGSTLGIELLQEADDLLAGLGVQVAGRLIGQNHGGIVGEHPGQGDSLLLADAQLARLVVKPVAQADSFQKRLRPVFWDVFVHLGQSTAESGRFPMAERYVTRLNVWNTKPTFSSQLRTVIGIMS